MEYAIPALTSIILMLVMDAFWLSLQKGFYFKEFSTVQCNKSINVKMLPALIAYTLMCIGFLFFVVPLVEVHIKKHKNPWKAALSIGLPFGLVVYGIYNCTNIAVLQNYSTKLAVVDTLWGTFLYTIVTLSYAYFILHLP